MPDIFDSFLTGIRRRLSSGRLVLVFGIIYFLSQISIAAIVHPIGFPHFAAFQLSFSKEAVLNTLNSWQAAGAMPAYRMHLIPDFFHPLWYALFLISALATLMNSRGISERWNFILLLPVAAAISDEMENLIQLYFLSGSFEATVSGPLAVISSAFSLIKWTLALGSLLIVFGLLFRKRLA